MSGIHEITLNDVESRDVEREGQPKLRICAVGEEVFFSVVQQEDKFGEYHADLLAEVAVHVEDLRAALALVTGKDA